MKVNIKYKKPNNCLDCKFCGLVVFSGVLTNIPEEQIYKCIFTEERYNHKFLYLQCPIEEE